MDGGGSTLHGRQQEDAVTYTLYAGSETSREQAEALLSACLALVAPLVDGFVWQCEGFGLRVVPLSTAVTAAAAAARAAGAASADDVVLGGVSASHAGNASATDQAEAPASAAALTGFCLQGTTRVGDNIDDEWFVVWLVQHLTAVLTSTHPAVPGDVSLAATVRDLDGELLLIEAGDQLPRWLDPTTAHNRVFLYEGRTHVVPQPESPATLGLLPTGSPPFERALDLVRSATVDTLATSDIQLAIDTRLKGYPQRALASLHRARCLVPENVLKVLQRDPQLVAAAVTAFYERDPIDMKACVKMKHFPPSTRVEGQVLLTRCLYAQLSQQRFQPGPSFGRRPPPSSPDCKAFDLGAKLACGFEMLVARAPPDDDPTSEHDFASDARWQRFVANLQQQGYFRDNIEGSKQYKELLAAAARSYGQSIVGRDDGCSDGGVALSFMEEAGQCVRSLLREERDSECPTFESVVDDDDGWMYLSPQGLDDLLQSYIQRGVENLAPDQELLVNDAAQRVKSFMSKVSSFEGAVGEIDTSEFFSDDDDDWDDDDGADDDGDDGNQGHGDDEDDGVADGVGSKGRGDGAGETKRAKPVDVDGDVFLHSLQSMLGLLSDMSDSGAAGGQDTGSAGGDLRPWQELEAAMQDELDTTAAAPSATPDDTMRHLLESLGAQQGLAGPSSTLLGSLGFDQTKPS
eukprot:m.211723 g.211723  ORF g.211723 m.211723 type:complete len:689 (+) comp18576_c0_seq7:129-2195(+)